MITAKRTTDPLKTNNEKQLPIYKKVKTTDYVHTEPTDDQVPWNFEADVGNESISETENNTYLPETEQIVEEESGQSSPNQCGQKTTLYQNKYTKMEKLYRYSVYWKLYLTSLGKSFKKLD